MSIEIKNKIVGYEVISNESEVTTEPVVEKEPEKAEPVKAEIIQMHEKLERPEMLL
ncbi:MAG: NrdJb, partial [Gammaproteobacteria bacterium]|nr:NrdJb [Gammaproteobacteria bacterium]